MKVNSILVDRVGGVELSGGGDGIKCRGGGGGGNNINCYGGGGDGIKCRGGGGGSNIN